MTTGPETGAVRPVVLTGATGVNDLCAGILRASELGLRGRLTLAQPQSMPIGEFYRAIGKRSGVRPWLVPLSGQLTLWLLALLG